MSKPELNAVMEAAIRVILAMAPKAGVVILLAQENPDGPGVIMQAASNLEDGSAASVLRAHIAKLEQPRHAAPAAVQ